MVFKDKELIHKRKILEVYAKRLGIHVQQNYSLEYFLKKMLFIFLRESKSMSKGEEQREREK